MSLRCACQFLCLYPDLLLCSMCAMTPTPHAAAIRSEVHAIVSQAHAVLRPKQALDLATLDRTFTLAGHDAITTTIGLRLFTAIRAQAPGVVLRFWHRRNDTDLAHVWIRDHIRHALVDMGQRSTRHRPAKARP